MKRTLFLALTAIFALCALSACQNSHTKFCKQAAKTICEKCASCGADGFKKCGLNEAKDDASCRETIFRICEAYEPDYNPELGRNCLESVAQATCDAPKPDICSRLF